MRKGSKRGCRSASHLLFKDKAKIRVDDLQVVLTDLQFARKESRAGDVVVLEEQVHQMLREWKAELSEASPASTLLGGSHVSLDLSSDLYRLLQHYEEEDDATSKLDELSPVNPKPELLDVLEPDARNFPIGGTAVLQENYYMNEELQEQGLLGADGFQSTFAMGLHHAVMNSLEATPTTHLNYQQFNVHQELAHNMLLGFGASGQNGEDVVAHMSDLLPTMCPPPSAFLRPKCALWDCPRPAQGSEWCHDYCSSFHATLALNEGPPGMMPVLRPWGIDLKDGPIFAALSAKTQGKNVGIPECEGAATTRSPWNAPELFDLSVLEGESLREWLFFDKPRRAFESGNRKQRSLPDYSGRGWHESRKQMMKEFGGLKRSYYMDPQPSSLFEWHLYEYEINSFDACALYRLELKLLDAKKSAKGKLANDSLVDLQQQMGRLNAENPVDNKRHVKGKTKVNQKGIAQDMYSASDIVNQKEKGRNAYPASHQRASVTGNYDYAPSITYSSSVDCLNDYYEHKQGDMAARGCGQHLTMRDPGSYLIQFKDN